MRSSQDLRGCRFWRHLAVFVAFGKGFHAQRICENATLAAFSEHSTNVVCDYRLAYQCRAVVEAFLAEDFFAARFGGAARPSTASRPAPRISSENSPLPATRASTTVPIMAAITAIARLRAALRGTSGISSASRSIIRSILAAKALRVFGLSRAISAASVGIAQPLPGSTRC